MFQSQNHAGTFIHSSLQWKAENWLSELGSRADLLASSSTYNSHNIESITESTFGYLDTPNLWAFWAKPGLDESLQPPKPLWNHLSKKALQLKFWFRQGILHRPRASWQPWWNNLVRSPPHDMAEPEADQNIQEILAKDWTMVSLVLLYIWSLTLKWSTIIDFLPCSAHPWLETIHAIIAYTY